MMMDDERMAHTFSAVCSPPISMMFKGRGRSSSKLKKMEIVTQDEELDEEVCDGLLKISKSSEELWKDVYAVFSPPTPIGSKMQDYMPFDSYKHPSSISNTPPRTSATLLGGVDSEANNNNQITALDMLSSDSGKTSVIPAMQYYPPNYTPPVLHNKYTNTPGTTVTNSISIQHSQLSNTKAQLKEEDDNNNTNNNTNNNPAANLKRSKRNSREQPSYSTVKRPPTRSGSAANINNIINESAEAGETREEGSPHVPRARKHNSSDNTTHSNNNNNNNQQVPLHNQANYNMPNHPHSHNQLENLNDRNHNPYDTRSNTNTSSMPPVPHLHMSMHNNAVYTGNTPMLDVNDHHTTNNNSLPNPGNYNHISSLSHDNPNTNHVQYNNNTPNSILNMGNSLSSNDKYWTEVIFSCKKLVALAGAGLANTLSFAELVDGLTLARHITSTTAAAVMNSGGYAPLQSAPVSDEFNRLVTETFGTLGLPQSNPNQNLFHPQNTNFNQNFNSHPSHTSNQQHQPNLHINANIENTQSNMFPFFSSAPLNGLPSSPPLSYSASSPVPYSPSTYPPPAPFSNSAPSTPISTTSSNGISSPTLGSPALNPSWSSGSSGGAFAFEELRKKLPLSSTASPKEEDSDESPVDSPSLSPKSPPLSALSLVPLSPCLSPGGSSVSSPPVPSEVSVKGEKERESKGKEREEKTSWKKPRGKKKRPKYEADLECRSCGVRQTPEWRRGPFGAKTLCNACGLHWAKVLKAEGKGDQKRVALLEAKRSQFMMTQKRAHGTRSASAASQSSSPTSSSSSTPIKNEPLYLSPHMSSSH